MIESAMDEDRVEARFEVGLEESLPAALGRAPTVDEASMWAGLSPALRERAVRRLKAVRRWTDDRGGMSASEAADEAGMKRQAFYNIAAKWAAKPELPAVGVYATAPVNRGPRKNPEANAKLQASVVRVVKANPVEFDERGRSKPSIDELVRLMLEDAGLPMDVLSRNTLRDIVERELRRISASGEIGHHLELDMVACGLARPDGQLHVMFGILDKATGLILGYSLGDVLDSRRAYAHAALDVLERMDLPAAIGLPWAERTAEIDVVVGDDGDAWTIADDRIRALRLGPNLQRSTGPKRFGRYIRRLVGPRLGRIRLFPARTETAALPEVMPQMFTVEEARLRIELEVMAHNAEIIGRLSRIDGRAPSSDLVAALKFLSAA